MLPMENQAAGGHNAFPDPCPTVVGPAVVPVPYDNLSQNVMAVPSSPNVLVTAAPALTMASMSPLTMGDNSAVPGTSMRPQQTIVGNPKVLVNGIPATTLTSPTTGNMMNCVGAKIIPSVTNVLVDYAGSAEAPAEELARLLVALGRGGSVVGGERMADRDRGIGWMRLSVFTADAPARVFTAVRRLEAEGMRALVLDLRGNPGGEVRAAAALAGDFLPRGAAIVTMRDADGDDLVVRVEKDDPYLFPLVILVDRRTASAAEIFAGSLQAHGRALVAGERTYGKGVGHAIVPDHDGAGTLHRDRTTFFLPGGAPIEGVGIAPDVPLPAAGQDPIDEIAELREHVG
jgi:carboxyl-terminal processing protease